MWPDIWATFEIRLQPKSLQKQPTFVRNVTQAQEAYWMEIRDPNDVSIPRMSSPFKSTIYVTQVASRSAPCYTHVLVHTSEYVSVLCDKAQYDTLHHFTWPSESAEVIELHRFRHSLATNSNKDSISCFLHRMPTRDQYFKTDLAVTKFTARF